MTVSTVKNQKRLTPVTVSKKGWVVIPKEVRERFDIRAGDKIFIIDAGGRIAVFKAPKDPIAYGYGLLKDGPSMAMEMVEEHRREIEQEEREIADSKRKSK